MLAAAKLQEVLEKYTQDFVPQVWAEEKYKWEAIQTFQTHWDVNAKDFAEMLHRSLDTTSDLLASLNFYPRRTIEDFAKAAPEEVRAMFIALYDESKDVYDRIKNFKEQAAILLTKHGNGAAEHYQHERAIGVYLWLRYPDRYYTYQYSEVKAAAEMLESNYSFKPGAYAANIRNTIKFYDEICDALQRDTELVNLFRAQVTDTCYPDPELKTLTADVARYIRRNYAPTSGDKASSSAEEWFPADYKPGLTVAEWVALLNDKKIFTEDSLVVMRRLKDYGGQATCKQLSIKYGATPGFYNGVSIGLAKRIVDKTGCPVPRQDIEDSRCWPVLYVGKRGDKEAAGNFIWKLRDELAHALDQVDLSQVPLYAVPQEGEEERRYWWLNANPKIWSFSGISVGEAQAYTLYNENGNKRRVFQNFLDAKPGDVVIGYESNPVKQVVALAKISVAQDGEKLYFEKTEDLVSPIDYRTLKECPELAKMEYFVSPQGSLFQLTKGEFDFIMDIIRDENPLPSKAEKDTYTKGDFLTEVYLTEERYNQLVAVLRNKKNIILQGAPGVGKTFAAKRLAYSMMGEKDENRIEFVQFHQNYSYEDFMMGYKPVENGFELQYGIFYRFCRQAANQPDKDYFFIIDEINRGNMSKIFGELLMLIEKDYRGFKTTLAYNGLPFAVPENLYIIGMMNTADRSLAMIDYALRRRFSFLEMEPAFDSDGFLQYQKRLNNDTFNALVEKVQELNRKIASDESLGKGFCIGHSYFCGHETCTEEWLRCIVDFDVLPMLSEYWFDDTAELQRWENILHGVFQ